MSRSRNIYGMLLLGLGLVTASCLGSSDARADLDELLVDGPPLPTRHQDPNGSQEPIDWRVSVESQEVSLRFSEQCRNGSAEKYRAWSEGGELVAHRRFLQLVCQFPSSAQARRSFSDIPPEIAAGWEYPNLVEEDRRGPLTPSEWSPNGLQAEMADVLCADGDADGVCSVWMYRGVYGSYVVTLMLDGGFVLRHFERLVDAVDRHVAVRVD